jgi:hypothetical protein
VWIPALAVVIQQPVAVTEFQFDVDRVHGQT